MGDFTPVIVAIVTTLGTVGVAYLGARKLGSGQNAVTADTGGTGNIQSVRDQLSLAEARAEVWEEKYNLEHDKVGLLQFDIDECERKLRNANASRQRQINRTRADHDTAANR